MSARRATLDEQLAAAMPDGIVRHRVVDRAAWLALRGQDVTASVIAALVGEHPYMTRLGLYALKTGQTADAEVEPVITENSISLPPMLRGTVLEQVAPDMLAMLQPTWRVEKCEFYYREPTSRIGATPDFIAVDPGRAGVGSIQVKTTDQQTFRKVWRDEEGAVTAPLFIAIQAVVEAVLTGAAWVQVAVMISGSTLDLHLIDIPLHLGIMDRLRFETKEFWRCVAVGEQPEPDYGRDAEVLAAMYREDNGQELDLTADNRLPEILAERDTLKGSIKLASSRIDEIDGELKARLGPYEAALIAGPRRVTWRTETRRHRFVAPSETRVLRISGARL